MIRAHEIILFFRFQNQAAGAMRRFSADMQAMNRTALAAQRRREFKTKETALDLRAADLLRKNRDIRAGMDARSISIAKQRLSVSRSIAGAEAGLRLGIYSMCYKINQLSFK